MQARRGEAPEHEARRHIVEVCRRIYARGWITATDGNVSALLGHDRVLCTPTGINKGTMTEDDLIVIDRRGKKITGTRAPSSEILMHLAAYDERPDVGGVVHAHPTNCIAFSLAGITLAQCLLPEIVFTFGSIPTTEYTTPTTDEVPAEVSKWLRDFDAMILDRHGSLTVGADVFAAYDKLERMEHVAEITFRARMLGPIRPLSRQQIERLRAVGRGLGLPDRKILALPCDHCNACPGEREAPATLVPLGRASTGSARGGEREARGTGEERGAPREADVKSMIRRATEDMEAALRRR
jgi:L-fuculose-phosphate aldolase